LIFWVQITVDFQKKAVAAVSYIYKCGKNLYYMKKLLPCFILILIIVPKNGLFAQKDPGNSLLTVLDQLSSDWKKDSVGNNGFRFQSYSRIIQSKIDDLSPQQLVYKIGKPNQMIKAMAITEYRYFVRTTPAAYTQTATATYIRFNFDKLEKKLLYIDQWVEEITIIPSH